MGEGMHEVVQGVRRTGNGCHETCQAFEVSVQLEYIVRVVFFILIFGPMVLFVVGLAALRSCGAGREVRCHYEQCNPKPRCTLAMPYHSPSHLTQKPAALAAKAASAGEEAGGTVSTPPLQ